MSEIEVYDESGHQIPAQSTSVPAPSATALALFNTENPEEALERASKVARAMEQVLKQGNLISNISGRKYIQVEGWTALGAFMGVSPRVAWSKPIENGWEARCEVVNGAGTVIAAAEAQCLKTERNWKSRDDFALRSMAQTRAMGKALRMPLGFIAVLAGYEATPAEEIMGATTVQDVAAVRSHRQEVEPISDEKKAAVIEAIDQARASTGDEAWEIANVLATASRMWGGKIKKISDLDEKQADTIIDGAKKAIQ